MLPIITQGMPQLFAQLYISRELFAPATTIMPAAAPLKI
jgi:hypothetical protein